VKPCVPAHGWRFPLDHRHEISRELTWFAHRADGEARPSASDGIANLKRTKSIALSHFCHRRRPRPAHDFRAATCHGNASVTDGGHRVAAVR
jgi:hypothetical protein